MSDFDKINNNISEVKTDVAVIKAEVGDMKSSITTSVAKISETMTTLAVLMERQKLHQEEHAYIDKKFESIDSHNEERDEEIQNIKISHEACLSRREEAEKAKLNSPMSKAKDKIVEYLFIGIIMLVLFIMYSHIDEWLDFMAMQNQSTTSVEQQKTEIPDAGSVLLP